MPLPSWKMRLLIISDIRMPGKTGVETVGKIQENHSSKKTPVIFITGYADTKIEAEAKKLNPIAYIYKPFDVPEIMKVIIQQIGH